MTKPIGHSSTGAAPRGRRPRKHKTGIFHLHDLGQPEVEWQQGAPSVPEEDDALLQRVAFECFICGVPLNRGRDHPQQDTNEDVFPRWLQRRYGLADLPISLGDRRTKKYSEILIPACRQCNNVYMSGIEDRVSQAVKRGFDSFKSLPKYVIFLWCAKIYYGFMHLEVQPRDGSTKLPEIPSLPPDFLKDCAWLLHLLQGFRKRVLVSGDRSLPFSVIRVPLQIGKDESFYFQSRHPTILPGIAVQMGRAGVISVFDDFGLMEERYAHRFAKVLDGKALHPIQFWELAGRLLYMASLHSFHTYFTLVEGDLDMWLEYAPFPEPPGKHSEKTEASWARVFAAPWTRLMTNDPKGAPFWDAKTRKPTTTLMKRGRSFNEMRVGDDFP